MTTPYYMDSALCMTTHYADVTLDVERSVADVIRDADPWHELHLRGFAESPAVLAEAGRRRFPRLLGHHSDAAALRAQPVVRWTPARPDAPADVKDRAWVTTAGLMGSNPGLFVVPSMGAKRVTTKPVDWSSWTPWADRDLSGAGVARINFRRGWDTPRTAADAAGDYTGSTSTPEQHSWLLSMDPGNLWAAHRLWFLTNHAIPSGEGFSDSRTVWSPSSWSYQQYRLALWLNAMLSMGGLRRSDDVEGPLLIAG